MPRSPAPKGRRSRKPAIPAALRAALAGLELLVLDIDGTLTDGRLYYGPAGEAIKAFDVRDGLGLRLLSLCAGVRLAALTGRRAELSLARCQELGFARVVGSSRAKGRDLRELCADLGVPLSRTGFMGDDVNDLPALALAGLSACPGDAVPEVRAACAFVAKAPGGRGAVRELCELLLAAKVGWPPPEPPEPAGR